MTDGKDKDAKWLRVCSAYAEFSHCTRRKVGAVLVRDGRSFASGYNGTPAGENNCDAGGCPRGLHYRKTEVKVDQLEKPVAYYCACGKRWPCPDSAKPNENYNDSACIHAEMNALLYAARDHTEGATVYCTDTPCGDCFKHIRAAGVIRIKTPDFEWNR